MKGSETDKNEAATALLYKFLKQGIWLNVHLLPVSVCVFLCLIHRSINQRSKQKHNVHAVEIRLKEGYGIRWTDSGRQFRGFLEPFMENGHEVGWRH